MTMDECADLVEIISYYDKRSVSARDVVAWFEIIGNLDKDDCADAIKAHFTQEPDEYLKPGHVVRRVKAMINDRWERDEPDLRAAYTQSYGGVRTDRYGYIDKSAPEPAEYPEEWTSEERVAAYWERIRARRDEEVAFAPVGFARDLPASEQTRAEAMAKIREVLSGVGRSIP